jgi:tetratricopeptide (TPR) repeat protein
MACNDLWFEKKAERYYKKGLKFARTDEQQSMFHVNIASVMIDTGRFDEAEPHCQAAIELNPDSIKAIANLGFCQLAQKKWDIGWQNYRKCIGSEWRPVFKYNGDEPLWEGESGGKLVLYQEQGLGDIISFASMLPDAQKDNEIVLDVEPRLKNLMQRSFPDIKVYGTYRQKSAHWEPQDQACDYSLPMGQIGEHYRTKDSDFPGKPYLVPDPDRVLQWKALFETKKKPVIGIAWRGGIPKTGSKFRQWNLEQLLPILKSVDAHWVSLQYKDAQKEIDAFKKHHPEIDIVQYRHGTLTNDYDDTVALIAALDQVVTMQTAVVHVAGALGVPAWVHVPQNSQWRYGSEGEKFMWADSVRIIRQKVRGQWDDVIKETAEQLSAYHGRVSKGAGKAPRKGKLRSNSKKVRPSGDRSNGKQPDQASA